MSNIDKRAQKEIYATVEKQAHKLRGNPIAYQVVTGMCPVNVIEMHAKKILALLDDLDAAERRIAEQRLTLLAARSYVMQCARMGDAHANGVLQAIDRAAAGKGE
ncbi:hypothetical protein ACOY7H_22215 [Enterobacter roggenkampii]|uniref:hypothetical protein n=1 Tax=Enterobacter roggenkampii TaxID=1812935 RepID=UPI00207613DD|nr:hypothetical protein [Enterobacter roggenkampii]MCM7573118.1 hypothetical protein [Enterobacter roggenkampii]HDS3777004.1 hypothetical protein [Enterobacter roggenkampii]HDT2145687.1 hypothetical protein [Enterobacter roggenkampii]